MSLITRFFILKKKSYKGYVDRMQRIAVVFFIICSGVCQSAADCSIFSYFTVDYVKTDFYRRKLVATVVSKAVEKFLVCCVPSARACLMCVFRPCQCFQFSSNSRKFLEFLPTTHSTKIFLEFVPSRKFDSEEFLADHFTSHIPPYKIPQIIKIYFLL